MDTNKAVHSTIGFIGAGTLATGLSIAMARQLYEVLAVSSRRPSSAEALASKIPGCRAFTDPQEVVERCRVVFITTPDDAVLGVASDLTWKPGQGVVHCSGAENLDVLEPAQGMGACVGSLHPFQTFACLATPEEAAERTQGITFAIEGEGWIGSFLEEMASRLGGRSIRVSPEKRALYHAAAVMSCGYLVTLIDSADELLKAAGLSDEDVLPVIAPIAETTIRNVSRCGVDASRTGPVARGDSMTLQKHLEALQSHLPQLLPLYRNLSRQTVLLARGKLTSEDAEAMERLLEAYQDGGSELTPDVRRHG